MCWDLLSIESDALFIPLSYLILKISSRTYHITPLPRRAECQLVFSTVDFAFFIIRWSIHAVILPSIKNGTRCLSHYSSLHSLVCKILLSMLAFACYIKNALFILLYNTVSKMVHKNDHFIFLPRRVEWQIMKNVEDSPFSVRYDLSPLSPLIKGSKIAMVDIVYHIISLHHRAEWQRVFRVIGFVFWILPVLSHLFFPTWHVSNFAEAHAIDITFHLARRTECHKC